MINCGLKVRWKWRDRCSQWREFLSNACVFAGACAVTWLTSSSEADNRKKPNVIFFFIDDMGWQDTSEPFYEQVTELNERYHTCPYVPLAQ